MRPYGALISSLLLWLGGCGAHGSEGVGTAAVEPRPPQQSPAYVGRCQEAVRRDMANARVSGDVSFATGLALAASPRAMNVEGEAEVSGDRGNAERYVYSCSFDPEAGDRLRRSGFRRAEESSADAGASPVDRCQADVRRTMNAPAPSDVQFVTKPATVVSATATSVQGDAEVEQPNGPARRYTYFCSFRVEPRQ